MFGLNYRAELYYQFGEAAGIARSTGGISTIADVDREAYMFGVRVGKTFKNVSYKPTVTLWYDYLSGTSDADQANGKWKSFDTLYDTGHKFYGLIDVFLGVGACCQRKRNTRIRSPRLSRKIKNDSGYRLDLESGLPLFLYC